MPCCPEGSVELVCLLPFGLVLQLHHYTSIDARGAQRAQPCLARMCTVIEVSAVALLHAFAMACSDLVNLPRQPWVVKTLQISRTLRQKAHVHINHRSCINQTPCSKGACSVPSALQRLWHLHGPNLTENQMVFSHYIGMIARRL